MLTDMTAAAPDIWLDALRSSLEEVGTSMGLELELDPPEVKEPADLEGSYISLSSPENAVTLAVLSSGAGCRALAGMLMGMEPEEVADLEASDAADGISEIANVLVGVLKTRVSDQDAALALGLPLYVVGHIRSGSNTTTSTLPCRMAGADCKVALIRHG